MPKCHNMNAKYHVALLPPHECQMSRDCQLKKSQRAIHCQDNIQPNHIVGFFYSIHSSHIASMWDISVS
ncbi:hypothetical protein AMTRI_Chr02g218130 [Amborella trichopoda]